MSGSSSGSTSRSRSSRAGSKASPRARARASGFESWSTVPGASPRATASRRPRSIGSPRRRSGSPGPRRRRCATGSSSTIGRPPTARSRRPWSRIRSRSRSRRRSATLLAADQAASGVKGIAFTESIYAAQRGPHDLCRQRRQLDRPDDHPRRIGHRDERDRRRRAPAPELPRRRRRLAVGRLRIHPGPAPGRPRRGAVRRGDRAAQRAAVPVRPDDGRPRSVPAVPPGPRELRPPDRARSGLRHRGVVRRAPAS